MIQVDFKGRGQGFKAFCLEVLSSSLKNNICFSISDITAFKLKYCPVIEGAKLPDLGVNYFGFGGELFWIWGSISDDYTLTNALIVPILYKYYWNQFVYHHVSHR